MRRYLLLVALMLLSGCGMADDNVLPSDGPITNPAIEAGATQAQGAVSSTGEGGHSLDNQGLRIEVDDVVVDVEDAEHLADLVAVTDVEVGEVPHCAEVVNVAPSGDITRCSYAPGASPLITDRVISDVCGNGLTFHTLNRPSGEGAFVGLDGQYWFELDSDQYSLGSVAAICDGTAG